MCSNADTLLILSKFSKVYLKVWYLHHEPYMQSPSSFPLDGTTTLVSLVTAQKEYYIQIHAGHTAYSYKWDEAIKEEIQLP